MTSHNLKTWPEFFLEVVAQRKTVEVRYDDREFGLGHVLVLQEWDPLTKAYTGAETKRLVTHVVRGWGVKDGYVAMSLCVTEDT